MEALRKFLGKKFGFILFDLAKKSNVLFYYNLYLDSLSWSRDKIEAYQVNQTKALLNYAYNNVPFYYRRFNDSGFNIEQFKYLDQLKGIPPLTRFDLQGNIKDLVSKEYELNNCFKSSSSGSTGNPVVFYHDMNGYSANRAAVIFCRFLGEYNIGEPWLNIWGQPHTVNVEWKKTSSKISKFIFNEIRFPAYLLRDPVQYHALYELMLKKKPRYVYGYTNAIYLFAKYLENTNKKIDFVKSVFTTAENLHDFQRFSIEKTIGVTYDQYGCSEISGIAAQTKYDNLYSVIAPHVYVEYGDEVKSRSNKIIITNFHNKVLPFIRYENGDLIAPADENSKTNSSINYDRFKSIDGRTSDVISLPDGGSLVVPSFLGSWVLKNVKGIKQYQVVRTNKSKFVINIINDENFNINSQDMISQSLSEYLPKDLEYELVFNKDLIYSSNGKFKIFIDDSKSPQI